MTPPMLDPARGAVVLAGVVGSRAYGLARPDSDTDRLGVYAAPTRAFHGLHPPTAKQATIVRKDPDITLHEVGKFCALALNCNPTVMELLWLEDWCYEHATPLGKELVLMRRAFLSAQRVRNAYYGYAEQQFQRLANKRKFPDIPRAGIAKHARHLLRLVETATRLWVTGELLVRVNDPARVIAFGERVAEEGADVARPMLARARLTFDMCETPLPAQPDEERVERWLLDVRARYYAAGRVA